MPFFEALLHTHDPRLSSLSLFSVYVRIFLRLAGCSLFLILPVNNFESFSVFWFYGDVLYFWFAGYAVFIFSGRSVQVQIA